MSIQPLRYGVAALLVAGLAGIAGLGLEARASLWAGAALALIVQGLCFAVLAWGARRGPRAFLAAWAAGIAFRGVAVFSFGFWGVAGLGLRAMPALLGMVAVLFVLLLLEPVGLRPMVGEARV